MALALRSPVALSMPAINRMVYRIEQAAWLAGTIALVFWVVAMVSGTLGARREMQRFAEARADVHASGGAPDLHLWSPSRVRLWQEAQGQHASRPLAVLRIRRIGLEVPVLEGTDEWTLNRAVGHIEGTARPGTDGNAGIAGHRDGFFRGLKDVRSGDLVDLETPAGVDQYSVERTWIVDPDDVSVLAPTAATAITFVTCYPFYFVGSAPQRFIVRAVRTGTGSPRTDSQVAAR
jgi:sortase A